jgi:ribonuclease VapC
MRPLVVETSALIAILIGEDIAIELITDIQTADIKFCPASCAVEAMVVLVRKGRATPELARTEIMALLQSMDIELLPLDQTATAYAFEGYTQYGKGTGNSPAVLNFGDCLSYGTAKAAGGKLLYTGGDFAATDLA